MFTRDASDGESVFDSTMCVEVTAHIRAVEATPDVELKFVYVHKATGTTYGTCPVRGHLLSRETLEHLDAFIKGAEEDFGKRVFGNGQILEASQVSSGDSADSGMGIKRGLAWRG